MGKLTEASQHRFLRPPVHLQCAVAAGPDRSDLGSTCARLQEGRRYDAGVGGETFQDWQPLLACQRARHRVETLPGRQGRRRQL